MEFRDRAEESPSRPAEFRNRAAGACHRPPEASFYSGGIEPEPGRQLPWVRALPLDRPLRSELGRHRGDLLRQDGDGRRPPWCMQIAEAAPRRKKFGATRKGDSMPGSPI